MHELSVASAILDTALRHAAGQRVSCVEIRVGALRQVVPDSLRFYFEVTSRGTLCEGARLEIEEVAAAMHCPHCGQEWDPAPDAEHEPGAAPRLPQFRCPACEGAGAEVLAGEELLVESIDVESAEAGVGGN